MLRRKPTRIEIKQEEIQEVSALLAAGGAKQVGALSLSLSVCKEERVLMRREGEGEGAGVQAQRCGGRKGGGGAEREDSGGEDRNQEVK